jgi:hypothetical protein
MFEILLLSLGIGVISPQGIAFLTSLVPVGAWVAKSSGDVAKSIVVSETTNVIKKFFRKRIAKKQLQDIYIQSAQATLDDTTLNLDDLTRANLVTTQHTFRDFIKFIDTYNQLNELPFKERRETAQQILREYIQKHVPEITDAALDKIEEHFSKAAFRVIDDSIKKSPEAFCTEALASLNRIEGELEKNNPNNKETSQNLEILKATALYYKEFAPDIKRFNDYLSNIDSKIDDIRMTLAGHTGFFTSQSETLGRIECGIDTISTEIKSLTKKNWEYNNLIEQLAELKETYSAISESEVPLRLKYSKKIEDQKKLIQSFKQNVIWLADTFKNNPIDSERLRQAQMYFEAGEFERTAELLNAEDLEADQQRLLMQKEESNKKVDKQLRYNATEFLIKAQVTALDYSNSNRFDDAKKFFIQSIWSYPFFDNLFNYAYFLQSYCKFDDAESVLFRIINDFKKELPTQELAMTLNNLASLHTDKNKHVTAEKEYTEALTIYRDLAKANPAVYRPDVAMTLNNLANLHKNKNEHTTAEKEYTEALTIRRDHAKANPVVYQPDVATTLNNLASLHADKNEHVTAEKEYTEALTIYRDLAKANPAVYRPDVAMTLNNLAVLRADKNEYSTAEKEYTEALTIRRDLAKANPAVYRPDVAMTLNNLASLHADKNEYSTAEKEYTEALTIYRDLAKANPAVYLPKVATTLNNLAILPADKNEHATAEKEYTEALTIRRDLAKANPAVYLPKVATTLNNLAILHADKNEYATAEKEYTEALTIRRDLAKANPAVYRPDVATTLNNLAILHADKNEHATSEKEYTEALTIYQNLAKANPAVYLSKVAMTLNNLAVLHADKNEHATAEKEYIEALTIYRDLAKANPAVYRSDVAMTLNNLASLHADKNEHVTAEKEYTEALTIYRDLAKANPAVYLPKVAMILNNLAILHRKMNKHEIAEIEYAEAQVIQRNHAAAKGRGMPDCEGNSSE